MFSDGTPGMVRRRTKQAKQMRSIMDGCQGSRRLGGLSETSGWRLTLGMRDRAAPLLPDEVGQTIANVVPDFLGVASLSRCNDFPTVDADRERAKHECGCVFQGLQKEVIHQLLGFGHTLQFPLFRPDSRAN